MTITHFFKNIKKEYLAAIIFAFLIVLFYGNTLFNGFVQDDISMIEKNAYIRSLKYLPKVVTGCIFEYVNKGCKGRTFYYRPIQYLSYFLTFQISSEPWIFHLANLIYFLVTVFLVFTLAKIITKNFIFAFISAFIFLLHPINSEVVNWVSVVSDPLFVIFILLAVIYQLKYRDTGLTKNLILVYLFYFLALLSKETAVLLPLIIISVDLLFFEIKIKELLKWGEFKKYLMFAIPFSIYFFMRVAVVGHGSYLGQFNLLERIYATVTLFTKYLSKLFYPYPLQAIYDFRISSNFLSFSFLISLIAVLIFFFLLLFFIKKQKNLLAFSLIWFFVFLSPPIVFLRAAGAGASLFFERYLFVPAIGFSLVTGYILCYILKIQNFLLEKSFKSIALLFLIAFVVIGSWYTIFQRNKVWKNNEILDIETLSQVPTAHNIRYQLGVLYYERGEVERAKEEFEEIIKRDGNWKDITMAYKGLGDYYHRAKKDLDQAVNYYQKAVETAAPSPRDYVTFNNLGAVYMDKENYLKGLIYFCQALQLYPEDQATQSNFEQAMFTIESTYIKNSTLYQNILEEFNRAAQEKIQYLDKKCTQDTCQYRFSFQSQMPEIIFPFLISAGTSPDNKDIKIQESSFDPQQGVIILQIDKEFSDKTLNFAFPTCQGIYYSVEVQPTKL